MTLNQKKTKEQLKAMNRDLAIIKEIEADNEG